MASAFSPLRTGLKHIANALCYALAWPMAFTCHASRCLLSDNEKTFVFWANLLSLVPGDPGVYLRRSYYRQTLAHCSSRCFIGFGAMFAHQQASVEDDVYIGSYALIGAARLRRGCLIGSRASLLSGGELHEFLPDGSLKPYDSARLRQIEVGESAWIGEGAILMANVGSRSIIAAGTVVANDVPSGVVMAGNPARFVRRVELPGEHRAAGSPAPPMSDGSRTATHDPPADAAEATARAADVAGPR